MLPPSTSLKNTVKAPAAVIESEQLDRILLNGDVSALKQWIGEQEDGVNQRIINGINPLTPLMVAIMWKSDLCVDYLIQEGADLHAVDRNRHNALHFAATYSLDHVDLCEKLIVLGIDPSLTNTFGQTLSQLARQVGNRKLVDFFTGIEHLLLEKKALTELLLPSNPSSLTSPGALEEGKIEGEIEGEFDCEKKLRLPSQIEGKTEGQIKGKVKDNESTPLSYGEPSDSHGAPHESQRSALRL